MADAPWLTIVGLGEDGPDGLSLASRQALDAAEFVMGAARHLSLLPDIDAKALEWPVPFADGISKLMALRGRKVVALASGDPFWFGAGSVLARHLEPGEWQAFPGPSSFSLAAARLGWPIEGTACLGLHAAPLTRLRPHLADGRRILVLLRDAAALAALSEYLGECGFAETRMHVLEALGGPRERMRIVSAREPGPDDVAHPVCVGLEVSGDGPSIPLASGRPDDFFNNDGQITKRPVRALTLSTLAPRAGETLWDIGGGSGSIAIEWLMAHPANRATAIEANDGRAERIRVNADRLGQDGLEIVVGRAPTALEGLPIPDCVFIGGGLSAELVDWLEAHLTPGTRIVANAVTLESEALLADCHARLGGALTRIELSEAVPLGGRRGWKSGYPVVQWSAVL